MKHKRGEGIGNNSQTNFRRVAQAPAHISAVAEVRRERTHTQTFGAIKIARRTAENRLPQEREREEKRLFRREHYLGRQRQRFNKFNNRPALLKDAPMLIAKLGRADDNVGL